VKWDRWSDLEAAIKRSKTVRDAPPVSVVVVANSWSPTCLALIKEVERIRKDNLRYVSLGVVDFEDKDNTAAMRKLGVVSCPSVFFYYTDRQFIVRRNDWDDDNKLVGSVSKTNLVELIQYARQTGSEGHDVLYVDF